MISRRDKVRAVLINAGQANAATGKQGYQDALDSADAVAAALGLERDDVLLESTGPLHQKIPLVIIPSLLLASFDRNCLAGAGVIGRRIKMPQLLEAVPKLAMQVSSSAEDGHKAAVAITTTGTAIKTSIRNW